MTGMRTLELHLLTLAGESHNGGDTAARAGEDSLLAERGLLLLLWPWLVIFILLVLLLLRWWWWWWWWWWLSILHLRKGAEKV